MSISRRYALKQLFVFAGGAIFLPACFHQKEKSSLLLHHLRLEPGQDETLEALADTLIPTDTTPGAKAVAAHLFVIKMMDDCYPPDRQDKFMKGLSAFEEKASKQYGKSFIECDQTQKNTLVGALDATADGSDDLSFFYHENKKLVIQGYLGSQYFLTKVEVYELVPGRWHGCVPVKKNT